MVLIWQFLVLIWSFFSADFTMLRLRYFNFLFTACMFPTAARGRGIKIKIMKNKNVQFKFKNIFSKDYLSFQCGQESSPNFWGLELYYFGLKVNFVLQKSLPSTILVPFYFSSISSRTRGAILVPFYFSSIDPRIRGPARGE